MREGLFVFCFRRSLGWCNPLGHLRLQLRLQRPDWVPAMSQRTTTIATVQMWFAQVNWITETTESDAWTSPKSAIIFRLAHLCPSNVLNAVSSVRLCKQARWLWPTSWPKTGAAAPGPLRSSSSQRSASAGGSGLCGLHVPALCAAVVPTEPVPHRRRGHQR